MADQTDPVPPPLSYGEVKAEILDRGFAPVGDVIEGAVELPQKPVLDQCPEARDIGIPIESCPRRIRRARPQQLAGEPEREQDDALSPGCPSMVQHPIPWKGRLRRHELGQIAELRETLFPGAVVLGQVDT
jgi:hypothetical protein